MRTWARQRAAALPAHICIANILAPGIGCAVCSVRTSQYAFRLNVTGEVDFRVAAFCRGSRTIGSSTRPALTPPNIRISRKRGPIRLAQAAPPMSPPRWPTLSTCEPGVSPRAMLSAHTCASELRCLSMSWKPCPSSTTLLVARKTPQPPMSPKIAPLAPTESGARPMAQESRLPEMPAAVYSTAYRCDP
eukprot:scaffold6196_cov113-Isochrysis_galbana.AAC.2